MKQRLGDDMLAEVSGHIAAQLGLHFPPTKWQTLEQAICRAARELGFPDPVACAAWFLSAPPTQELLETLANYLTVGETYFLRENRSFEIMEQEIIPELIRTRHGGERRLRIWSAGCATGEEPYTIAILLRRMAILPRDWKISIMATDINTQALRKAAEGVYTEWSFRSPPRWFKEAYFRKTGQNRYELIPEIRQMVTFACLNLADDFYPAFINSTNAMDMIFCRNVLMYFTPQQAETVVERLRLSLVDGGWLFVSPCETSSLLASRFRQMKYANAIIYRKQTPDTGGTMERTGPTTPVLTPPTPPTQCIVTTPPPCPAERAAAPAPPAAPPTRLPPCEEASALYRQGHYGQAIELLTEHLAGNGDDAAALALLCRVYANKGRLDEALRLSERAIASDKLNAGMHYFHAVILQEQGDLDRAAAALKRALYLDHELVLAHFSLGNLTLRQGKTRESRRHFDNALALLQGYAPDEAVPESDGMLAGRLAEIIQASAGCNHGTPRNLASRQGNGSTERGRLRR